MNVIMDGKLNPEFVTGCATTNARALLRQFLPGETIHGRSHEALLSNLDDRDVYVTPEEFAQGMWPIFHEGLGGTYHIMVMSTNEWLDQGDAHRASIVVQEIEQTRQATTTINTGQPLAARLTQATDGNRMPRVEILYLGEALAELHEEEKDYTQEDDGTKYWYRAYREVTVPILSLITIDSAQPYAVILTRPIHRGVTPGGELIELQIWTEEQFHCPFPPVTGVKQGLKALQGINRIRPVRINVEEDDGCRVEYVRARGQQNPASQTVERTIRNWDTNTGNFILDDLYRFRVDTRTSIFSFGSKTNLGNAHHVIQTVLGAAP